MADLGNGEDAQTLNPSQQRLLSYKASLNLLRVRRYNLQIEEGIQTRLESLDLDEIGIEKIWSQVDALNKFVGHLINIKTAINTLQTNRLHNSKDEAENSSEAIKEAIYEISELSEKIVLYLELSECDYYDLLRQLRKFFIKFSNKVAKKREIMAAPNEILKKRIEKADRNVKKLNITRLITKMLMSVFLPDKEAFPNINAFRTSLRRDLVLEDFKNTWDFGVN